VYTKVKPGGLATGRAKLLLAESPETKTGKRHLLGFGLPIHIADIAVYLASDEAAITTAQVLSVDSGATIV
jgi:NAD(P)-dependent dehydrogenase (short-subunit alcohol dehydrogenase family)